MKLLKIFLLACIVMVTGIYGVEGSQSNILWHNSTTGAVALLEMNGTTVGEDISVVTSSNTNLVPRGIGDFTGDSKSDILFHNQNSGNLRIWKMNGAVKVDNIQILGSSNTNLKIAGVGNFDRDTDQDIATFNTNSGALRIWVMDGTTRVDNVLVLSGANTNLVPRGVGDMDGDGIPDLVLRNSNSGAVRVWTMNDDFTRKDNVYVTGSSNTNLELRGIVDINGDGNNDILNYNTNTGVLRAWLMDGNLKIIENIWIAQVVDLEWSMRGAAMSVQVSRLADIWRIYFTRTVGGEEEEKYLNFSLADNKLQSLSEFDGAVMAQPVSINGSDIYLTWKNDEEERQLRGSIIGTTISGTWKGVIGDIGTWVAKKGLVLESTTPIIYESGDIVMQIPLEKDGGLVTFYGIIPQGDEEPIYTEFEIDTDDGPFTIDLDKEERMTKLLLGNQETTFSYNPDGSFNYLLYVDGQLLYSGSDLVVDEDASVYKSTAFNTVDSSSILVVDKDVSSYNAMSLNAFPAVLQNSQDSLYAPYADGESETMSFRDFFTEFTEYVVNKKVNDFEKDNKKKKVDFLSYVVGDEAIVWTTEQLAFVFSMCAYRFNTIEEECSGVSDVEKCKKNYYKALSLWTNYIDILEKMLDNMISQAYDNYNGEICIDADKDGFYVQKGCGTKVDCDDKKPHVHPGAREICDDGNDNDCDSFTDCNDLKCTNNVACPGPYWKRLPSVRTGVDYNYTHEYDNIYYGGKCYERDWYTIEGETFQYEFSHKGGEGCSKHIDISGKIGFVVPPSKVKAGATVPINLWGYIGGYKSAMADGLYVEYTIFRNRENVLALSIQDFGEEKEITKEGVTFNAWVGEGTKNEFKTYSFPMYGNEFFIELKGDHGVGIRWDYVLIRP